MPRKLGTLALMVMNMEIRKLLRSVSLAILRQGLRVVVILSAALIGGFLVFASFVTLLPPPALRTADAIVALTGGEARIAEAVRLLSEGHAKRLLISGVNPSTTKPELISLNGFDRRDASFFKCCVDLDKRALNTEENAVETTTWARQRGFRSIIVVTSAYHMPRTLIELRQTMPDAELIPFPVMSASMEGKWWGKRQSVRVVAKEYLKFLTAVIRYTAKKLEAEPARSFNVERSSDARAS